MRDCARPREFRSKLAALALGLAAAGPAVAQQFVDETATRWPVPNPSEYTNQLTFGDIDGDDDLDIIFANGGNFNTAGTPQLARVYINNGTGFFTDETTARTGGLTGLHRGVEMGDCDNDGDLDVVLAQDFVKLPNLLINNGSGIFTQEAATRLPNILLTSSRGQFGDVDNDGDLDLFFTTGASTPGSSRFSCGQYRLYLNDGTCHYTDATSAKFPIANVCNNMDCIFGDIDGDFDIDLKTASTGTNQSRLYRNDGTGSFTVISSIPPDEGTYSYDFGDMDGDGDLDLFGANGGPGNSDILYENDGGGGYTDASSGISPNPSQDDNDSKFFDYDDDGDMDLIIARLGGTSEKIYNNDGTGFFAQVSGLITPIADSSLDVKVGDLTGDGAYDVVTGQGESGSFQDRIYINHGPADTSAPRILGMEQVTDPDDAGPYVVRTLVLDDMTSDRNFVDHGMTLHYTVDAGPSQSVALRHSGGQVYRGEIPGQPGGSSVEYWVRAVDSNDNVTIGSVLSFLIPDCGGLNDCSGHGTCIGVDVCACDSGWGGPDCSLFIPTAAGAVPDGSTPPTPGLRLRKATGGNIRLFWSASCGPDDEDYAIYQGTVGGGFTSHVPRACSTLGATQAVFVPDPGDLYYLIVPTTVNAEGSYGSTSAGPRPASTAPCLPQATAPCP